MKKKTMVRKYLIVIPSLLTLALSFLSKFTGFTLFNIPTESSFHFNLITINSIFAGFLYTNYSLLLSLADKELIKKLQNTSIIDKRNSHILNGILCSIISIVAGMVIAIFWGSTDGAPSAQNTDGFATILCKNAEIIFMVFSLALFLLSIKEIHILIKAVNKNKDKLSEQQIEELKEKINTKLK